MNLLIIKTSALGDIVQTFPVLQELQQTFPTATIDWVVEKPFASLVEAHPFVHQVLTIQSKQWRKQWASSDTWQNMRHFKKQLQAKRYDYVFDLQGNSKSAAITALVKSDCKVGFGWKTVPEWPNAFFTHSKVNPPSGQTIYDDYLSLSRFITKQEGQPILPKISLKLTQEEEKELSVLSSKLESLNHPILLICSGSQWINKQMTVGALQRLLEGIHKKMPTHFIFVWGNETEQQTAQHLQTYFKDHSFVLNKYSLPLLQNYMQKVDGVLAMDSLPLHLAATTSTPTYSVFGASAAKKYQPLGEQHAAFQGTCPYGQIFHKRCSFLRTCSTGSCIRMIDESALLQHFLSWWAIHQ